MTKNDKYIKNLALDVLQLLRQETPRTAGETLCKVLINLCVMQDNPQEKFDELIRVLKINFKSIKMHIERVEKFKGEL